MGKTIFELSFWCDLRMDPFSLGWKMPSGYGLIFFFTALLFSFIRFYLFFLIFEHYSGTLVILQDYLRVVFVRMG
jgi:hypothetical protein